jgi:putative membrane protein
MIPAIGSLTEHMAVHLLLMNALAPLAVLARPRPGSTAAAKKVFPATAAQLALLWAWHAPPLHSLAIQSPGLMLLAQLSLFLAAFRFWSAILALRGNARWRGLLSLLLTSKLFCLLGALLVFSPRLLYPDVLHLSHAAGLPAPLADQHLAGLLMLVVCPASYLTAGVLMAARWIFEIDAPQRGESAREGRREAAAANAG